MKTWTPLWSSIVTSSIWGQDKDARLLWVTMLAIKVSTGFVESSVVGLARQAVLTVPEVEKALHILESPDPYSRTKLNGGRRIKAVEGGWVVLNHEYYRNEISAERTRQAKARWAREHRKTKKVSAVSLRERLAAQAYADGDTATAERLAEPKPTTPDDPRSPQ